MHKVNEIPHPRERPTALSNCLKDFLHFGIGASVRARNSDFSRRRRINVPLQRARTHTHKQEVWTRPHAFWPDDAGLHSESECKGQACGRLLMAALMERGQEPLPLVVHSPVLALESGQFVGIAPLLWQLAASSVKQPKYVLVPFHNAYTQQD
jgi:hypothetical protein